MYHRYFELSAEPFGVTPDPRFFFASAQHTEAAASLYYAVVQRRGFAALIAAPGLGKTSVIVSLLPRLRERADVVFLVHPKIDADALLESVLQGLGINPDTDRARRSQQLTDRLLQLDDRGRSCVVILDEAQNLSFEALESVRMLSNYEMPDRKLVQFILVGQPGLGALLMKPDCEQIRQRINIIARLQPLSPDYVAAYIEARVRTAGASACPFSVDAIRAIAAASGGVPRTVNTLCFNSLGLAFADNSALVTVCHVADAAADLRLELPAREQEAATAGWSGEIFRSDQRNARFWEKVSQVTTRNWRSVSRALRLHPERSN